MDSRICFGCKKCGLAQSAILMVFTMGATDEVMRASWLYKSGHENRCELIMGIAIDRSSALWKREFSAFPVVHIRGRASISKLLLGAVAPAGCPFLMEHNFFDANNSSLPLPWQPQPCDDK